ncbi:MAG: tetratricopeptide repeat protein [Syntrophaceae bacterium]|nr:tetratricopeptide repeat protein [Syntrophaceae bacterium]
MGLLGVLVLLGALALGPSFGWAQPASPETQGGIPKEEMEKAWFAHREILEKGDWERSRAELEKVYQWKLDQGIRNHYSYALALIRESERAAKREIGVAASELLLYAERMAPDFSEVKRARAAWLGSHAFDSFGNAAQSVWSWFQGFFLSFANPDEAIPRLANLTFWLLLSFFLTFAAFSFSCFLRHYSFFNHHLRHLVGLRISPVPMMFLSFLLLLSPLFLDLGWMWLFALWTLAFWTYGRWTDRVVTLVLVGLLLLLPAGVRFHASLVHSLTGKGVPEILRANYGAWDEELYQKLLSMNREKPEDADVLMALGLVEKRMGKYAAAEQRFSLGARLPPKGLALHNLGNVFLATNRLEMAMEAYQEAARLDPSRPETYYNLGQANLLKLRMKEAEAEFQRAKGLEPAKISYHTGIASKNPNRLVMDRTLDPGRVWERVLVPSAESDRIARSFWELLWKGIPLDHGEMGMAALLGLLGLVHLGSRRIPVIRHCERCGTLICPLCNPLRGAGIQCLPCQNAFTANPAADLEVVRKKRGEVARYQTRVHLLPQRISWILPGMGHLMRGRSLEGIVYLFVLTLMATRFVWWEGWVPLPLSPAASRSVSGLVMAGLLFLLFYGFVQYRMECIRLQEVKSHFQRT